jgi:hypothetical protein
MLHSCCRRHSASHALAARGEEEIAEMRSWVLAVGLLAAATSGQAMAADLDDGPSDRYGSAYDDPRYADMYRYPEARRPPVPREPIYGDRNYDDRNYDDRDAYQEPRRYSYAEPRSYRGGCVPREQIKYRLKDQGWNDFRDPELRGEVATVIARRPSGRPFELTLDRCTGDIVNVRRLDGGPYGPYANGPGPRRWDSY